MARYLLSSIEDLPHLQCVSCVHMRTRIYVYIISKWRLFLCVISRKGNNVSKEDTSDSLLSSYERTFIDTYARQG